MRQIVLDTETTGLSPNDGDRLIELGCVELVNRKLTGNNLHIYVNPERESHPDALRVHGITSAFLADKPKFHEVVEQILEYLHGADEVLIHNAPFDVGFLNKEFQLVGKGKFIEHVAKVVDTLAMAKQMFPGKRNGLDALCDRLEVDNSGRTLHGALLDAELLADVYINMTRGQNALSIDEEEDTPQAVVELEAIDYSQFDLPILRANEQECSAHEEILANLDKATGNKTLWRKHQEISI
ncbi:DNA polymerase III subunit epsilon [Curvibacter sp. CHRR-16]|uniref:DNA polymerase III subunit epsilon n=1 Tax=Curvibacter sp. CHRR-16 TaxID=2835872 RepID=UPI001BD9B965|nr:DNA polymerase III subunit epsilon [Curvibacter sp. CHRR-16]MBT0571174.1 DNA polymerase III subunit epsilon [Curvibacter sp. CHRR-16]